MMGKRHPADNYGSLRSAASYMIEHPPSLCPPCAETLLIAVAQISSNASPTSSPVAAEHSMYLSALSACAAR